MPLNPNALEGQQSGDPQAVLGVSDSLPTGSHVPLWGLLSQTIIVTPDLETLHSTISGMGYIRVHRI